MATGRPGGAWARAPPPKRGPAAMVGWRELRAPHLRWGRWGFLRWHRVRVRLAFRPPASAKAALPRPPAAPPAERSAVSLFSAHGASGPSRSEEHTSELQSLRHLVCRL